MHIVVLPFPILGHLFPFLMLARLLASQGFTFTFVVTEEIATQLKEEEAEEADEEEGGGSDSASKPRASIKYATVPCEGAPEMPNGTPFDFAKRLHRLDILRPAFESLLRKLASSPLGVSAIISDCFVLWGQQVASDLNIPAFLFYTTNAYAFMTALHAPSLVSSGLTDLEKMVDCIPGLSPLRVGDLPRSILAFPSFATQLTKDLGKAAGLILNSVLELEKEPLEVIRSIVPVYTIGPMPLMQGSGTSVAKGQMVGPWVEQRECLDWLNTRRDASVLFVAFGSLANMNGHQLKELAVGLEASEQVFLWVIRSNDSLSSLLAEGFMEKTKDRGLIISWAPQLEVLSHPAVGAFLTHCGWNSLTENLSLGAVPMICWPQLAEQRLNKRLLVDKWRVGLELPEKGGIVKRADLEKVVREVMQGEVGKELRKRALEYKAMILAAVQEGGSSHRNLVALGEEIRRLGSKVHVINGACSSGQG